MKTSYISKYFVHFFIVFFVTTISTNTFVYGESDSTKKNMETNITFSQDNLKSQKKQAQSDISKIDLNSDIKKELDKNIRASKVSKRFARFKTDRLNNKKISGKLRQQMLSAQLLKARGELSQSCSTYTEVIEKYPEHKEAVRLARTNLIEIFLEDG